MKVVINKCIGGFSISKMASDFMGLDWNGYGSCRDISRDDPKLVECVEQLGDEANGRCARLKIVEIPEGTLYTIPDYNGVEHVAEVHQTWD